MISKSRLFDLGAFGFPLLPVVLDYLATSLPLPTQAQFVAIHKTCICTDGRGYSLRSDYFWARRQEVNGLLFFIRPDLKCSCGLK